MRSSFLSFAPDVSKEQCQAEHWIDIENVSESVKMTPEEIENLNARILRTYGTEMHDLKNEAFAKEERVVYDKLVDCLEKCLICRHIRRFAD